MPEKNETKKVESKKKVAPAKKKRKKPVVKKKRKYTKRKTKPQIRMKKKKKVQTLLQQAEALINGPRREEYGDAAGSFVRIAIIWTGILGRPTSAREVALCMVGFKTYRATVSEETESLLDIMGYASLAENL